MTNARATVWPLSVGIGALIGGLFESGGTAIGESGSAIGFPISWIGILIWGGALIAASSTPTGIVGASAPARAAVVASGAVLIISVIFVVLASYVGSIWVNVYLVVGIAGILLFALAAFVIVRRKVLVGFSRWILLIPALWGILGLLTLGGSPAIPIFEGFFLAISGIVFLVGARRQPPVSGA